MAYASASDVAALTKNILGSETMFSDTSKPTIAETDNWLSSGCSKIETMLNSWGYSTPAASTSAIWGTLKDLNTLYAAGRVELARTNVTLTPGERTRGQVFLKMFDDDLKDLEKLDLTPLGLSRSSSDDVYVGGISISDKQTQETDSDRVDPRFTRGQMKFPGTSDPSDSVTAS